MEYNNYTGYNSRLKGNARALRKNMTWHEKRLWYGFLKNHPIKFYKQRVINTYIADFYCSKAKLVIELDGSQHYEPDALIYDAERTEILKTYGLTVLRFSNSEIQNNFSKVCQVINTHLKKYLNPPDPE